MATTAVNETFAGVRNQFYATVYRFWEAKGGDLDDLMSEAHGLYMDALDDYDHERGNFDSWVCYKVHKGLLEGWRKRCVRRRALPRCVVDFESMEETPDPWRDLSDDARAVVEAVLTGKVDAPKSSSRYVWRQALLDVMVEAGWTVGQVARAFAEVREALS